MILKKYFALLLLLLSFTSKAQVSNNNLINITQYDLKLQIIPESKLIRGDAVVYFVPNENTTSLELDFHSTYDITSIKVNNKEVEWKLTDSNKLILNSVDTLYKGVIANTEISYYNTKKINDLWDKTNQEGSFFFSGLPSYLIYPCKNNFSEKAIYKLDITVPEGFRVQSFAKPTKGVRRNQYIIEKAVSIRTTNFVINLLYNYSEFNNKFAVSNSALSSSIRATQYTPIDSTIVFRDLIKLIPQHIADLGLLVGKYPYDKFNVVITKDTLSHQQNITRETLLIPYKYSLDSVEAESRILFGISKQWFGSKIRLQNEKDKWIIDGLSKYAEWSVVEKEVGKKKFVKMMNSKYVEVSKYMGIVDWRNVNPFPIYEFDLHNSLYEFGTQDKEYVVKKESLGLLFRIISLDTVNVSNDVKISFKKEFGYDLSLVENHDIIFYDFMKWAKNQPNHTFKISKDGFFTLKSVRKNSFITYNESLMNLSSSKFDKLLIDRAALFFYFLRNYYGDEVFYDKYKKLSTRFYGKVISTEKFIEAIKKDSNGDIDEEVYDWIYATDKLPLLYLPNKSYQKIGQ